MTLPIYAKMRVDISAGSAHLCDSSLRDSSSRDELLSQPLFQDDY